MIRIRRKWGQREENNRGRGSVSQKIGSGGEEVGMKECGEREGRKI